MLENRSKGIVGIFLLVGLFFFIFLLFAFYTMINLKDLSHEDMQSTFSKDAPIGVIDVEGVIMSSRSVIQKLIKAQEDTNIEAIILRINSPGGAVGPTQEIYEEIRRIDEIKPVYASFGTVAASGGYYIGAAARKIYSPKGAMTGSIGVIMNFMNLKKLYEFAKLRPEIIKAGKFKDIGSPARDMSIEEREILTSMTADVHEQFIMDIFDVRGKKIKGGLDGLREYAQGQIYSGSQAKSLGLVDENLGLWQAARAIHKELDMKKKFGIQFIKIKKDISFFEILNGVQESMSHIGHMVKGTWMPLIMFEP